MRQIRKNILNNRLETNEDIVYLPMTLSKMISFILERTKNKSLRKDVVKTIKNIQEATLSTGDSEADKRLIL
jgi:hypothetical protein